MKHYKYGGSTAARTLACPSWIDLAATLPKDVSPTSPYALEGTALHECMENILNGDIDSPEACLGMTIEAEPNYFVTIDEDQVERLNIALEAWDAFCKQEGIVDFATEQTFELTEHIGGTADVIAWSDDVTYVVDWKFGQGIAVSADNSAQGMFYAMCARHEKPELFEGKGMAVAIIQPIPSRDDHDTLQVWNVPADAYAKFRQEYFASVAYEGEPVYNTGPHCTFCPAAAVCPSKSGQAEVLKRLNPEQAALVGRNLELALELEGWINQVKKLAHEQMEIGTAIDGFKLVQKRATRKWDDEDAVEKKLRKMVRAGTKGLKVADILTAPKLISPPQIEKLFKQKEIDFSKIGDYIVSESSGTTIAPDSDKRQAVLSKDALKAALQRTT